MTIHTLSQTAQLFHEDCRIAIKKIPDNSVDSCCTDPPYHLVSIVKRFGKTSKADDTETSARARAGADGMARMSRGFMGTLWDGGDIAFTPELWAEVYRVLKPGAHLVAFGSSRGYHRMACAIEDAGFEVRDSLMWIFGVGFPKSHNLAKGIDAKLLSGSARTEDIRKLAMGDDYESSDRGRANYDHGGGSAMNGSTGAYEPKTPEAAEWEGWGTAIKPSFEPIVLARKPLSEPTVAANVLRWRTGALNIGACRIGTEGGTKGCDAGPSNGILGDGLNGSFGKPVPGLGRWPANVVTDGSDEVVGAFPDSKAGGSVSARLSPKTTGIYGAYKGDDHFRSHGDSGSAARFFYSAKASKADRNGSKHPTVKPISLMEWLVRLVTPPGGTVLDPFAGSGTTGIAATNRGFRVILCEREAEYVGDIRNRFAGVQSAPAEPGRRISRIFADEKGIAGGRLDGSGLVSLDRVRAELALLPDLAALQARLGARA